jgi:glycosyltransferase involved in cell wall biosynthesis
MNRFASFARSISRLSKGIAAPTLSTQSQPGGQRTPILHYFENCDASLDIEIVILVPISPSIPRQFINSAIYLVQRAAPSFRMCRLVLDPNGDAPPAGKPHPLRQAALAKIRQEMIEKYLGNADWVAWIDADIVDYPSHLISDLVRRAENGIAAPLVLMDGERGTGSLNADGFGRGRFFDVAGFVEDLRWARFDEPWFDQPGPVYSLDSVGSLYVVNAEIYRQGARHMADKYSEEFVRQGMKWRSGTVAMNQRMPANCFTEHFSVCQWAKDHGYPVRAFGDLIARHAIV